MYEKFKEISESNNNKIDIFSLVKGHEGDNEFIDELFRGLDKSLDETKEEGLVYYIKKNYVDHFEDFNDLEILDKVDELRDKSKIGRKYTRVKKFVESFYDKIVLLERKAEEKGKKIDDICHKVIEKYYAEDNEEVIKYELIYSMASNILESRNLTVFHLSKNLNPIELKRRYHIKSQEDEEKLDEMWKAYRNMLEEVIGTDLSGYKKAGYISGNSIDEATDKGKFLPRDPDINNLLKYFSVADRSVSKSHAFFKSFKEMTEEERQQQAEEENTERQRQELEDSKGKNPKKKETAQEEKKPSARYQGKNGRGGIWR